ncbi:CCA tRNA nucleotidyltransferase, mitochondrial [Daldinia childiae]|uniref:CCA tRNA nucleotidyltransferase, mitochondrial n=1 Tax=Daldinia childiae TaxID=326645 RepID=UPI0014479F1E|nr:CCA tRNA nucleotidyltransferase, mitochondrial [Daldinia childiae]KAF3066444.1 CCA tRNA nucleotidyltransferase, mitochondrial [Daldinia childiae]
MVKRKSEVLGGNSSIQPLPQIRKMATQPATTTIELSPKEAQLKDLLLDAAKFIDKSRTIRDQVILRWAGGWVRDKLLGIESHDIDTAINVMTGEAFALKLCVMCQQPDAVKKHGIEESDIGGLYKIARNPEKSKHLETTTIKLFGYDVDFVNLRKETYTQDSRNPQMKFGTAEEDALRRDATVNALFYNLNTGKVEDFTTGLTDMKSRLIRTPLEPFQTFMDDPLRVLRLVRFASRLEFTIDPTAEKVMGDPQILDALRLKISRERIGIELQKMLKGNHPRRSLEYINDLGLYHTIFTDPSKPDIPSPDISNWKAVYECLDSLRQNKTPGSIYDVLVRSDEAAYYAWVLVAVCPWENVENPKHSGKGKAPPPLGTLAIREGIKATNKLCDLATTAHNNRTEIMSLVKAVSDKAPFIAERDRFGMAIRRWDLRVGHWRVQVLYAFLVDVMNVLGTKSKDPVSVDELLRKWQAFLDHLQELDIMEAPSLERIIDGNQLTKALGVRPGKWLARALEVCIAWQLRHPENTDPAGAVKEVQSKRAELGIPRKKKSR